MFALIASEDTDKLSQLMVKQLKNRYNDPTAFRKFMIGVDRAKMKLYDVEETAQKGLSQAGHIDENDRSFGSLKFKSNYDNIKL